MTAQATPYINNPRHIRIEKREWYDYLKDDISPMFKWDRKAAALGRELRELEETPLALQHFIKNSFFLDDYHYWFFLGVLWVSYTGWSDLEDWKHLFLSKRPHRAACLMKPTERRIYNHILPKMVHCFRAHRPNEKDWISYTLDLDVAKDIAKDRGLGEVQEYVVRKKDIIALLLRRHEYEVLCLDKEKAVWVKTWKAA